MLILTAHTLRHLVTCERRVWLDAHGDLAERDEISPETQWVYSLGIQHEQMVQQATATTITPVPVSSWEEGVTATRNLMRQGAPGIIGAFLEYCTPLDLTDRNYTLRPSGLQARLRICTVSIVTTGSVSCPLIN